MAKVAECPYKGCDFRTRDAGSLRAHIIQSHSEKEE